MWLLGAAWLLGACSVVADTSSEGINPNPTTGGAAGTSVAGGAGSTSSDAGSAGQPSLVGGAAGETAAYDLAGYFDLSFDSVEAKLTMGPGDVASPSKVTALRIDLHNPTSKGGTAIVTPRWGQPSIFQASMSDGVLVLTGTATLTSTSTQGSVTEVWQSFSFPVRGGKKLTGEVGAQGQQSVVRDSKSWSGVLSGSGTIVPDATAPEGRAGLPTSVGPGGKLMPWEPLRVVLAEPIASDVVLDNLQPPDGKSATDVSWVGDSEVASFGLVSTLTGYRQSWGGSALLSTQLADGFRDPAQIPGKGFQKDYDLVDVPQMPKWDAGKVLTWGQSEQPDGAECEGKSCLAFGPFQVGACAAPAAGAALRLTDVPDGAQLQLRVRVFTTAALLNNPGGSLPEVLSVETARVGQSPILKTIEMPTVSACAGDGVPGGDLSVCSNWNTVTVAVPAGSGEVGVAVRSGVSAAKTCASTPAGSLARVVISSIGVAPSNVY